MNYHTIIIGAGISGMTAALYLKRANKEVCIIEKSAPGGQLLRTSTVENYPACKKTDGATLAMNLYEQMNELEISIKFEEVTEIKKNEEGYLIVTNRGTYSCINVVIATGRIYKKMGLENEEKLTGKGISYCAICDGSLYKGKNVAVIGAGNSAFEEALYLSNLCNKVTIIARKEEYRAEPNFIEEVKNKSNIEVKSNTIVEKIIGETKLEKLILKNIMTNETEELEVEGCFIYIGQIPETTSFEKLGLEMENGYILTNEQMQTNIKNIYACGDVRQKTLYQLVTATYDGAIAADTIIKNQKEA